MMDRTTRLSFHKDRKITLVSLTPKQMYEHQVVIQKESELESVRKKKELEMRAQKAKKNEREKVNKESALNVKQERKSILFAKANIKGRNFYINQPLVILICKNIMCFINSLNNCLLSVVVSLCKELMIRFTKDENMSYFC